MTYHRDRPEPRAACEGKADLFESTDTADHHAARLLCMTCPVRNACLTLTREEAATGNPEGTWAGKLFIAHRSGGKTREPETCLECHQPMVRTKSGRVPDGMVRHCSRGRCATCDKRWRDRNPQVALQVAEQRRREENAYTDEQARLAYNAYDTGDRSEWSVVGCRVHRRRQKRAARAEARAAA